MNNLIFKIILLLSIFYVTNGCQKLNQNTVNSKVNEKVDLERLKLKNAAFCTCREYIYPNDTAMILDGSKAGYFQTMNYQNPHLVLKNIDDFTKQWVDTHHYESHANFRLGIMQCLDFYNSKELDKKIKEFDKFIEE